MAENFITRFANRFADRIGAAVASYMTPERVTGLTKNKQYFEGDQKKPLKTKTGQADDNLVINWVGLAVHRSNSMLFGGGLDFTVPDPTHQEWLNEVWKVNKKNILLGRTGMWGEVAGTWYMKILPEAIEKDGTMYPRLVLLNPLLMSIVTDPMDIDHVLAYIWEMKLPNEDVTVREVTRRADEDGEVVKNTFGLEEPAPADTWIVEKWESGGRSSTWKLLSSTPWPYPFPPIMHCQNLPSLDSPYGLDGFNGSLDVQDKHNFVESNILKIIRYHAHPKTWGRGIPSGTNTDKVSWGSDEMIKFSSETAQVANLEMQSDLGSSRNVAQDLKQAIFELARVVDIASLKDKIGALTNFGLRVLYGDALSKNATRRELYGDALMELNRRMFLIAGAPDGSNEAVWGSDMPADEKEDAALILQDLAAGILSKETAATKRGYVWKTSEDGSITGEQDKIANEKTADDNNTNLALANLFAGRTTPQ